MAQANLRKPVVSGKFYPSSKDALNSMIASFAQEKAKKIDCLGAVLPHAGYIYSGKVATQAVSGINIKDNLVLLGPNHTGQGAIFSIMPQGSWQTPLGDLEINAELAGLFLKKSRYLETDNLAHQDEHSLEVELPILQYFRKDFKIVPIALMSGDLSVLKEVAQSLAEVIEENNLKSSTMFIASSDMTHYEPLESAQTKDALAIEAIVSLNEDKLGLLVKQLGISICGFAPVAVLIKAAKLLGAKGAKLIKYQTSGDATGDTSSVVGYAGITIY